MAGRGPAPKPTKLRILSGVKSRRAKNVREPAPQPGEPECPGWLPAEAKAEWKRIVPQLLAMKLLTKVDHAALVSYCIAVAELRAATETLEEEGRFFKQNGSRTKHPAIAAQRTALTAVRQYLAEFGLSPSARTRIHVQPPDDRSDPLRDLLRRKAEREKDPVRRASMLRTVGLPDTSATG